MLTLAGKLSQSTAQLLSTGREVKNGVEAYHRHVTNAAVREVVIIGTIAARRARKHYVVAAGKVWIDDCRHAFRTAVVLNTYAIFTHSPQSHH